MIYSILFSVWGVRFYLSYKTQIMQEYDLHDYLFSNKMRTKFHFLNLFYWTLWKRYLQNKNF